jgi:hypothetical protein
MITFGLLVTVIGCSFPQHQTATIPYFDTKSFFEKQISLIKSKNYRLKKELFFRNKKDVITPDSVNWDDELSSFTAVDLMKPVYRGKFVYDSLVSAAGFSILYSCNDNKNDIKQVEIHFDQSSGKPVLLRFTLSEKNTLYESEKVLSYYPDSAFSIEGKQHIKLSTPITYHILGHFIRN